MSDAVVVALIAAGALVLGQIVNLLVSVRGNSRQSKQLIEIHTLTNGNLSKVTTALEVANQKIEGLQKLVTEMVTSKKDAKELADKGKTE